MDLAFFETNGRTEFSDELYAVIGRALTFATHYDINCKALANTIDIRQNVDLMHDQEKFHDMLEKWSKRQLKGGIDKVTSTIKTSLKNDGIANDIIEAFEETIFQPLEEGRIARNFIAHELALGMAGNSENEDFRKRTIDMVKNNISIIAKADFFVAGFIENHINKRGITPSMESYIERIVDWVCKTYD